MPRIDAEPDGDFHRLIKLRECRLLDDLQRLPRAGTSCAMSRFFAAALYFLPCVAHQSMTSRPIERAAPATIAIADSIDVAS